MDDLSRRPKLRSGVASVIRNLDAEQLPGTTSLNDGLAGDASQNKPGFLRRKQTLGLCRKIPAFSYPPCGGIGQGIQGHRGRKGSGIT